MTFLNSRPFLFFLACGMYLKISEPISLTGSAGGPEADASHRNGVKIPQYLTPWSLPRIIPKGFVRGPPRPKAEAKSLPRSQPKVVLSGDDFKFF